MTTKIKTVRLNENASKRLEKAKNKLGVPTDSEIIRRALDEYYQKIGVLEQE